MVQNTLGWCSCLMCSTCSIALSITGFLSMRDLVGKSTPNSKKTQRWEILGDIGSTLLLDFTVALSSLLRAPRPAVCVSVLALRRKIFRPKSPNLYGILLLFSSRNPKTIEKYVHILVQSTLYCCKLPHQKGTEAS